ncbi:MAG: hypothetical protein ACK46A_09835, partial [Akkermansiaceae bacterium]
YADSMQQWVFKAPMNDRGKYVYSDLGPILMKWTVEKITEKSFDEFHLYTIGRPVTLRNQETKQVEFIRGSNVKAPKIFVYDGATMNYGYWNYYRGEGEYGVQTNKKASSAKSVG